MKSLKKSKTVYLIRSYVLPAVFAAALVFAMLFAAARFSKVNTEQDLILTEQSIRKAVVQCFADEGRYPVDIDYIENNYDLKIDYDRFYVNYDCAAANAMPNISVFKKNSR